MTGFDFVVLAILLASVVVSMMRGLVREVLSLVAFAAALVAAVWWGPRVQVALASYIETDLLRMAVAYAGLFIGVLLAVGVINIALGTAIRSTGLAPADRGLGAMFGLARGLLVVLVLVAAAGYTPFPAEAWWRQAMLSPLAEQAMTGIKQKLPPGVGQWIPYPYVEPDMRGDDGNNGNYLSPVPAPVAEPAV